jgi:hypothetical protein
LRAVVCAIHQDGTLTVSITQNSDRPELVRGVSRLVPGLRVGWCPLDRIEAIAPPTLEEKLQAARDRGDRLPRASDVVIALTQRPDRIRRVSVTDWLVAKVVRVNSPDGSIAAELFPRPAGLSDPRGIRPADLIDPLSDPIGPATLLTHISQAKGRRKLASNWCWPDEFDPALLVEHPEEI